MPLSKVFCRSEFHSEFVLFIRLFSFLITVADCGPLTDPINGQVNTSNGTIFRSTATYTCDTGYTLNGSQSRMCGADELWTTKEPICQSKLIFLQSYDKLLLAI